MGYRGRKHNKRRKWWIWTINTFGLCKKAKGDLIILSGNEILRIKNGHNDFQNKLSGFFPGRAVLRLNYMIWIIALHMMKKTGHFLLGE